MTCPTCSKDGPYRSAAEKPTEEPDSYEKQKEREMKQLMLDKRNDKLKRLGGVLPIFLLPALCALGLGFTYEHVSNGMFTAFVFMSIIMSIGVFVCSKIVYEWDLGF